MSKDKMPAWMREANEAMRRDVLGEPRPMPAWLREWPEKWPVPTDAELAASAEKIIEEMCKTDRWRMSIPAQPSDSDIVLAELVRRFRLRSTPDAGDAALGAALRAAVQQNDPGDYLIVLRREYAEGFDVYTHDRFADPRESDATRTLASLLSRAAQPAKEEG